MRDLSKKTGIWSEFLTCPDSLVICVLERGCLNCGLHMSTVMDTLTSCEQRHLSMKSVTGTFQGRSKWVFSFLSHGFWAALKQCVDRYFLSASRVRACFWHVLSGDWPHHLLLRNTLLKLSVCSLLGVSEVHSKARYGAIIGNKEPCWAIAWKRWLNPRKTLLVWGISVFWLMMTI